MIIRYMYNFHCVTFIYYLENIFQRFQGYVFHFLDSYKVVGAPSCNFSFLRKSCIHTNHTVENKNMLRSVF